MASDYQNMTYALKTLANQYNLNAIYAFGSRSEEISAKLEGKALNSASLESDLDIGVHPAQTAKLSPRDKVALSMELEDLFNVPRVDLVLLSEATPFLALDIIRGELVYCNDYDAQAEYELYVLRRAGDLAHFERQRRRLMIYGEE